MKYYRGKKNNIDYTNEFFQKCITCRNACGGCSWSREFVPVKGWTAEKNTIPDNGKHAETYKIIDCPEYILDRKY